MLNVFISKKYFSNYHETTATKKTKEISKTKKNITCVKEIPLDN